MPFLISTSSLLWEGSWGLIHSSSVVSFPTSCKNKKVWEISYVKYSNDYYKTYFKSYGLYNMAV